jgi:predicted AlkP superfamily pyrophosphatase or phosphodiesterase
LKRRNYDDYVTNRHIKAQDILQIPSIFQQIPSADGYFVISEKLKDTPYDSVISKGAKEVVGFSNFSDSMDKIQTILKDKKEDKRKFVLHYWEGLDAISHTQGIEKSESHFREIFNEILELSGKIQQTNPKTQIFVTADHGMVDIPKERVIKLRDHPQLDETLTLPLSGEGRAAFCFVRAPYREQFETYILNEFKEYCTLLKMQDLFDMELFGLFDPHPRFKDRVPDYILLMKDNYIIMDKMLNETRIRLKAVHGGLSEDELYVPLLKFPI